MCESVFAIVVTHRRPDELAKSLDVLSTQTRLPDHLIVVDNDGTSDDSRVRDLVAGQPISTSYLGSRRNLGGAGGFALGMLHALAQGADWVWLADDDGRPQDTGVLATLLACAEKYDLAEVSPMVCDLDDPERLAFPLRRGVVWRRRTSELRTEAGQDLLPGFGLGITNLVARPTAQASELHSAELKAGREHLAALTDLYRPRIVAIAGVTAYRTAFGQPRAGTGPQPDPLGPARIWVLPNPSGLNASWTIPKLVEAFRDLRLHIED